VIVLIVGVSIAEASPLAAAALRWIFQRDARDRRPVIAAYEPPAGISIPVAADLLRRPKRGFSSGLVDLAVRHRIQIVRGPRGRFGVRRLGHDIGDDGMLLARLFDPTVRRVGPDGVRWLDRDDALLRRDTWMTREVATETVVRAGLRTRRSLPVAATIRLASIAGVVVTFWGLMIQPWWAGLAPLVLTIACVALTLRILGPDGRLTPRGAEVVRELDGLRRYVEMTQADRVALFLHQRGADATRDGVGGFAIDERLRRTRCCSVSSATGPTCSPAITPTTRHPGSPTPRACGRPPSTPTSPNSSTRSRPRSPRVVD
jgi:hypothetical protein